MSICIAALVVAACGGQTTTPTPTSLPVSPAQPANPPAAEATAPQAPVVEATLAAEATALCEEYFGFCISAQATGAVDATGAGGWASSSNTDCTALTAPGAARILELPNLLAAGEQQITVALTRVGAYTGPGTYQLSVTATGGAMPDQFPTVRVGSRAFTNGDGSTASVTINADGSGSLEATGLVEMDAMQGVTPDPSARVDFAMQWTCQGQ
jgi:hypothetical protein